MDPHPKNKKIFLALISCFIIAGLATGIFWQNAKRAVLTKQLQEVEGQIVATEGKIKELSELSPEEIAKREKEQVILSATSATEDVLVQGVEITKRGDKKIIKNNIQGYRIEIPNSLLVARSVSSDHLELHDKTTMCEGDPLCKPTILITVVNSNPSRLELEQWFLGEEQKAGTAIYSPREKLVIDGQIAYKAIESEPPIFDNIYYYWSKENKIYSLRVSAAEEPDYLSYVKTFRLEQ